MLAATTARPTKRAILREGRMNAIVDAPTPSRT
jgi:hypothetical protein